MWFGIVISNFPEPPLLLFSSSSKKYSHLLRSSCLFLYSLSSEPFFPFHWSSYATQFWFHALQSLLAVAHAPGRDPFDHFDSVWKTHRCYAAPTPKAQPQTFVLICYWLGKTTWSSPFILACYAFNEHMLAVFRFSWAQNGGWVFAFSCTYAIATEVLWLMLCLHLTCISHSMGISCHPVLL